MKKGLLVLSGLLLSTLSFGQEARELHMRVRATGVVPIENATIETIGGNVNVTNNLIPEVDFTYYFTKNAISKQVVISFAKRKLPNQTASS